MLIVDTHILLLMVVGELTDAEAQLLASQTFCIASITLWEIGMLSQRGRIDLGFDSPDLLDALNVVPVRPITIDVCRAVARLDFRSDPADELIAATSLAHDIPLLTRDRTIRTSKVIPLADVSD